MWIIETKINDCVHLDYPVDEISSRRNIRSTKYPVDKISGRRNVRDEMSVDEVSVYRLIHRVTNFLIALSTLNTLAPGKSLSIMQLVVDNDLSNFSEFIVIQGSFFQITFIHKLDELKTGSSQLQCRQEHFATRPKFNQWLYG